MYGCFHVSRCAPTCCLHNEWSLARVVGVDPVDQVELSVITGGGLECFVPAVSEGSPPVSESDDQFAPCSSATSDVVGFNDVPLISDPHKRFVGS
jgi:hypothetical protein